jgi:hypothetical protein
MRCAICGNLTDRKIIFNLMEVWREAHEWTCMPQEGIVCAGCIEWIREGSFKEQELRCEAIPHVVGPQKFWSDISAIAIGIFDGELLGLRCGKVKYGVDMVNEVLQGYCYEGENGDMIHRATTEGTPETMRCASCRLALWACNALEVTV